MPQIGWELRWKEDDGTTTRQNYLFDDLIEWSKSYPDEFNYTPGTLVLIHRLNAKQRDFISPSMLSSCPRQEALKRLTDYFVLLKNQWAAMRGTLAHEVLEREWQEPGAILETRISANVPLPDGSSYTIFGQPDKYTLVEESGERLLIDYKTIDELTNVAKPGWVAQLNCYAWLLAKNGQPVDRILVQQISMKDGRRVRIPIWATEKVESYMAARIELHRPTFEGQVTLENLPGMLDPVLDASDYWQCLHRENWCPVRELCWQLHNEGK